MDEQNVSLSLKKGAANFVLSITLLTASMMLLAGWTS